MIATEFEMLALKQILKERETESIKRMYPNFPTIFCKLQAGVITTYKILKMKNVLINYDYFDFENLLKLIIDRPHNYLVYVEYNRVDGISRHGPIDDIYNISIEHLMNVMLTPDEIKNAIKL